MQAKRARIVCASLATQCARWRAVDLKALRNACSYHTGCQPHPLITPTPPAHGCTAAVQSTACGAQAGRAGHLG